MISSASASPRILLGEITGVHGIKGEVVIRSYAADPEDIGAYGPLSDQSGRATYEITPLRSGPKGVVARVAGIQDRTAAEQLRGTKLYIARAALPAADDNEFYVTDLVGLRAVIPQGTAVGKIVAVHNFGAGDIVEVAIAGEKATELVPFTDAYFPLVDVAGGHVHLVLPASVEGEDPPSSPANENGD